MTEAPSEVADLVARCVALRETEGDAAVDRICAEHPEHADDIRRRLAALAELGLLDAPRVTSGPAPGPVDPAASPSHRLGPFELLGRLGGGGMGEVHLARQAGLDRLVALKLVRPDHLHFAGARERFRREAEAVAQLKHPGIVPVYTVGEEDGVPYLAMECVDGATLDEVLSSVAGRDPASLSGRDLERAVLASIERRASLHARPPTSSSGSASTSSGRARTLFGASWVEAVLRLGMAVTEALQHAHDQGVLHRDVKPSNLMLTLDGRVLLLDFGLALRDGGERITRTGAVMGSLAYMPPEQVRGEVHDLDGRVDVYALGATLHELLALRPPFSGSNQEELRRAILEGGAPSVREANPSVGRDAATLLQVALGVHPDDRYATPAALGADLTRVIERRPLQARPPSPAVRAWRWAQRRPATVTALALLFLVVVGGPVAYAILADRHADDMTLIADKAQASAVAATAAERETVRHFELARQAIDALLIDVSENELFEQPRLLEVRARLLEKALVFYDSLVAARPEDRALRLERLAVMDDVAFVLRQLGRLDASRAAYARLLAETESELTLEIDPGREPPGESTLDVSRALRWRLHSARVGASVVDELSGDVDSADSRQVELLSALEADLVRFPEERRIREELARATGSRARRLGSRGDHAGAEGLFVRSLSMLDELIRQQPDDTRLVSERLDVSKEWAFELARTGRAAESVEVGLAALPLFDRLGAADAAALPDRIARLGLWTIMGGALVQLGAFGDAERLLDAAEADARAMQTEHPGYHDLGMARLNVLNGQFELAEERRQYDVALQHLLAMEELARDALAARPEAHEMRVAVALSLHEQSRMHREGLGQLDPARTALLRAVDELATLAPRMERTRWMVDAERVWHSMALVELERGEHADSARAAETMAAVDPEAPWQTWERAARLLVRNVPTLDTDARLSDEQRAAACRDYVDRTLDLLAEACRRGMDDPRPLQGEGIWSPLKDEPRLAALRASLARE